MPVTFGRWLRATSLGWILGVPVIALLALLGEALGIGGVQVLVGAGMGVGVGLAQARAVRDLGMGWKSWLLSCVVGLSLPFLVWDAARRLGHDPKHALYVCVATGGLLVGIGQARLLRRRFAATGVWIGASALGWALASGGAAAADRMFQARSIRGIPGALLYLGLIFSGGPVLGAITGWALRRLRESRPAAPDGSTVR